MAGVLMHHRSHACTRWFARQCSVGRLTRMLSSFNPSHQMLEFRPENCGWTVKSIKQHLVKEFIKGNVSEPEQSASLIIAQSLGKKTLFSVSKTLPLSNHVFQRIQFFMNKRLTHMPLQYVLEEWDFKDITLRMKPPVFIPRPETEELVEYMVHDPVVSSGKHFIEIGTGSGAICLSLLSQFPKLHCSAIEKGDVAASLTVSNAQTLKVANRLNLLHMTLDTNSVAEVKYTLDKLQVDFIVSNPPYIPSNDIQSLQKEVQLFEDKLALDGGEDGLDVVKNILQLAKDMLKPGGSLWLETDSSHPQIIERIAPEYDMVMCKIIKDFQHFDRFCHLIKQKEI